MYKTILELEKVVNYDNIGTDSIWVSEFKYNIKELENEYKSLRGLEKLDNLPSNMVEDTREDFKIWLKKKGFKQLKTKSLYIGD